MFRFVLTVFLLFFIIFFTMAQNDKDNKFNYGLGVSYSIEKVSFAYSYEIYEFINYAYIQKILISGLLKFKTHQVNLSFVTAEQPKRIYIKHTNNKLFPVRINSLYGFNGSYRIYPEKIRIKQILSFFAFCDINYLIISTEGKCSGFYMDQTGMNVTNGDRKSVV